MNAPNRILVAGIGNIFLGDDAFGVEVVHKLIGSDLPEGVEVVDFGIRGYDLAYAIMDGYAATILVDTVSKGNPPGTLYVIEPDTAELAKLQKELPNGHNLGPVHVLHLVQSLGGQITGLYLVGCEPAVLESEDGQMGLSEPVRAAVPQAVEMIRRLVNDLNGKASSPQ
ncbi:MAG: hydrogenase maturation protease [Verrucomicrobia bacterium]|nr:hydrogenase maturation protease [Verrucomicrobiota bacterium]